MYRYVLVFLDFPNPISNLSKLKKSKNKINAKMNRILNIWPHELLSLNRGLPLWTTIKTHRLIFNW